MSKCDSRSRCPRRSKVCATGRVRRLAVDTLTHPTSWRSSMPRRGTLGLGATTASSRASAAALEGRRAAQLSGSDPSPCQGAGTLGAAVVAIQPVAALGAEQHGVVQPGRKRQAGAWTQERRATVDASRTFCPLARPVRACSFAQRPQQALPRPCGPQERGARGLGKCRPAWRATWR